MAVSNKPVIEIYTEYTPNPDSLKFVANKMLLMDRSVDFQDVESAGASPLALALFEKPYVAGVFISGNFVSVSKQGDFEWIEIVPEVKQVLKDWITADKEVLDLDKLEQQNSAKYADLPEVEQKIISILETYVKPAVENDGGNIEFQSFEDGKVCVSLQGACSGCPSATITLKQGIEGMLKKMVPEVNQVIANMD